MRKEEARAERERECRILLDAGADVIVPAEGLPMMLFGAERGANIDGAPIVNGITLIASRLRWHQAARDRRHGEREPPLKLRETAGEALKEFLEQG